MRLTLLTVMAVCTGQTFGQPSSPGSDVFGDPLPAGAVARIGTSRLWHRSPGGITAVAYLPDGKSFVSAAGDTLRFWEAPGGKLLREWKCDEPVVTLAIAPDGKRLATSHYFLRKDGGYEAQIRLWNIASGKEEKRFNGTPSHRFSALTFSPESSELAAVDELEVHRWQIPAGKAVPKLDISGRTSAFAYSPDGKHFALGGYYSPIHVFDRATEKELFTLKGHTNQINALAFSPDSKRLASLGHREYSVRVWDLAERKQVYESKEAASQTAVIRYSPDGRTLASADKTLFSMRLWDKDFKSKTTIKHSSGVVSGFTFSPDSETLVTAHWDGCLRLWDPVTGNVKDSLPTHRNLIAALAFLPQDKNIVTVSTDGTARVWDSRSGKHVNQLPGRYDGRNAMTVSRNGRHLAWVLSTDRKATVEVWDVANGKLVKTIPNHLPTALALSDDGRLLAMGFFGGSYAPGSGITHISRTVDIVEVATSKSRFHNQAYTMIMPGDAVRTKKGLPESVEGLSSVCFSPDGAVLATDASQQLALIDAGAGKVLKPALAPVQKEVVADDKKQRPLKSLAMYGFGMGVYTRHGPPWAMFSPDGQLLLLGHAEGSLQVFERATAQQVLTVPKSADTVCFALAGGNRLMAVAEANGRIRFWDLASQKEVGERRGQGPATTLAFAANGALLASGHDDGSALVWDMSPLYAKLPKLKAAAKDDLGAHWIRLLDADADKAQESIWAMSTSTHAVAFLRERLKPVRVTDLDKRLQRLIADVDSDRYADRIQAVKELKSLGAAAGPAIQKALAGKPSLEARRRLEPLLEAIKDKPHATEANLLTGETLRTTRAIRVLEHIGSAEAINVLRELARGTEAARETHEANMALQRLNAK